MRFRHKPRTHCQPYERFVPTKPPSWIRKYKERDAWLWTEVAAVVVGLAFVIPTAIALWIDLEDRQTQRIAQAWELATRKAPGNSGKGPALEYLNSQGITLIGINLSSSANGGETYLQGVKLSNARLPNANLSAANLRFANFANSNMLMADLSRTRLRAANLSEAYLHGAILSNAVLPFADLSDAKLNNANLSEADLSNANLSGADLQNADLSGAHMISANLSGTKLRDVHLAGSDLRGADLSNANLSGANLSGVNLYDADLSDANLRDANVSEAKGLVQQQLDTVCGNERTMVPEGLTIDLCQEWP